MLSPAPAGYEEPLVTSKTPDPIVDWQLARSTTQHLVGRLEAVAMLVQAGGLVTSAVVDKLLPSGQAILFTIAALHVVFAGVVLRFGGPFRWGPQWAVIWIGLVFLMPLVMAHLVAPTEYASSPSCVQLCGYPNGVVLLVAFYPWLIFRPRRLKNVVEVGIILAIYAEHLLLATVLHNGHLTRTNVTGITAALLGNSLSYMVGKAVGHMCYRAAQAQLDLQRENYDDIANFLHSHVRGTLVAVQGEAGGTHAVIQHLRQLDEQVTARRLQMLLMHSDVLVAAVVREHISRFAKAIIITESPQTGALTVAQPLGLLLSRALGDLLSNATKHATQVGIRIVLDSDQVRLDVIDNGPGINAAVLDDPATSLHSLRRHARSLGGDLTVQGSRHGTHLRLTGSMTVSRRDR